MVLVEVLKYHTGGTIGGMPTSCVVGATSYLATELIYQLIVEEGQTVHGALRGAEEIKFIDNQTGALRELGTSHHARMAALRTMPHADRRLWLHPLRPLDSCVDGVDVVYHTLASPEGFRASESVRLMRDVFDAIERTAAAGGYPAPRVVLTSCADAVMRWPDDKPEGECFDEDDWDVWSAPDGAEPDARRHAKVAAEREAWRLADERNVSLAVVNPAFMVGPARTRHTDGASLRYIRAVLEGGAPPLGDIPMVDVRDAAAAHRLAGRSGAGRRHLVASARLVPQRHALAALRVGLPPHYAIASAESKDEVEPAEASDTAAEEAAAAEAAAAEARAAALRGGAGAGLAAAFARAAAPPPPPAVVNDRVVFCGRGLGELGLTLRDVNESLVEMARGVVRSGAIRPRQGYPDEL